MPTSQAAGSVIINGGTNAMGLNNTTIKRTFHQSVRNVNNSNLLMYNVGSKEFTYGNTIENNVHVAQT